MCVYLCVCVCVCVCVYVCMYILSPGTRLALSATLEESVVEFNACYARSVEVLHAGSVHLACPAHGS